MVVSVMGRWLARWLLEEGPRLGGRTDLATPWPDHGWDLTAHVRTREPECRAGCWSLPASVGWALLRGVPDCYAWKIILVLMMHHT